MREHERSVCIESVWFTRLLFTTNRIICIRLSMQYRLQRLVFVSYNDKQPPRFFFVFSILSCIGPMEFSSSIFYSSSRIRTCDLNRAFWFFHWIQLSYSVPVHHCLLNKYLNVRSCWRNKFQNEIKCKEKSLKKATEILIMMIEGHFLASLFFRIQMRSRIELYLTLVVPPIF